MNMQHISHNHYRVSDVDAGKLAKFVGKKLPAHGYMLLVQLPDRRPADLMRTPYSPSHHADAPKRGWVWCVMPLDDRAELRPSAKSGGGARAQASRVKSAEELRNETEFYRRRSLPGCEPRYLGPNDVVLMANGHELGSKTTMMRRGKEVGAMYVLPSLAKYEALMRLPVAKSGGGVQVHGPRKSAGHIGFDPHGREFFEVDGEVYVAPASAPLADVSGKKPRRHGRWECSRPHFERYRKALFADVK